MYKHAEESGVEGLFKLMSYGRGMGWTMASVKEEARGRYLQLYSS